MRRIVSYLLVTLLPTTLTSCVVETPVHSVDFLQTKTQIQRYHDSGQYNQETNAVVKRASAYLSKQIKQNHLLAHPKKLAIVFDIDETTLSNYEVLKNGKQASTSDQIYHHISKGIDPAILPALKLYQQARKNHVAVFFVTGRRTKICALTKRNLEQAGYTSWAGLYCRPQNDTNVSVIPFKSSMRRTITEQGYVIIATIGDQKSDLMGGYAKKGFKLPNPFYYLP